MCGLVTIFDMIAIGFPVIFFAEALCTLIKRIIMKDQPIKKALAKFAIKAGVALLVAVGLTIVINLIMNANPNVCRSKFGYLSDNNVGPGQSLVLNLLNVYAWANLVIVTPVLALIKFFEGKGKKDKNKGKVIKAIIIRGILVFLIVFPTVLCIRMVRDSNAREDDGAYAWKPIIYIYPKEEMDLSIKFKYDKNLTSTYPKYDSDWNIHVDTSGTIYDYKTNRNYYALYWEGIDNTKEDFSEGFLVKGEDTAKFLEEKLSIIGLNEREINEFIIFWLPKMENNKYNLVRFRTTEEVNEYMPLEISEQPDTLIRVIMDYKPVDEFISIKEQELVKQEREGYTIVEWGGRELK